MTLAILSIEDSPTDFRLVERALRNGGLDAVCSRIDNSNALDAALERHWDVILSDYNVPGMCFEDSIENICRHHPLTPVVLVSGSIGEERAVDLLKLGAWDFVLKDKLARLVPAIERCLRETAERRSRLAAERALRESEDRLRTLGDNLPDGAIYQLVTTANGTRTFSHVSQGVVKITGVHADEILGDAQILYAHVHPDDTARLCVAERHSQATGTVFDQDVRMIQKDGSICWLNLRASPRRLEDGRTIWDGIALDITARRRSRDQQRLAASVFAYSQEGIIITDANHLIIDINPAFSRITGFSRDEVLGKNPFMLSLADEGTLVPRILKTLRQEGFWRGEVWSLRKSGERFPELLSIVAVADDKGLAQHFVSVFTDISQLKTHEAELDRIAHFDPLTSLPNRQLLAHRMEEAIERTHRTGTTLAICYLDLDGFKTLNDRFGHDAGDQLLRSVVGRLQVTLGSNDTLARLGGDEFVLLAELPALEGDVLTRLDQLRSLIAQPTTVDNTAVSVSASIGVTLFPHDFVDAETLLRHADQAMHRAKEAGKNRYHLYDLDHEREVSARHDMLHRLAQALAQSEFTLYFQPMVNLATHEVVSAEALIRWQHPERGLLAPGEFLPYLTGTALEIAVGEWVIETALDHLPIWRARRLKLHASVNLSANQLLHPLFVTRLEAALARHPACTPNDLELEILESAAINDIELARQTLEACCRLGVCFALDDFGTGYASLTYFRKLPVGTLKIDQTFVRDMLTDPEDLGIVESVIRLADVFKRAVVAEGVETAAHGDKLLSLGCQLAQGYGIARPMPAEELPAWIARWNDTHHLNRSPQAA